MNVVWTDEARDELSGIYTRLEPRSLAHALGIVERLTEASQRLRLFPEMGRIVSEYDFRQLREVVVGDYRLMYFIAPDQIEVITVCHGATRPG